MERVFDPGFIFPVASMLLLSTPFCRSLLYFSIASLDFTFSLVPLVETFSNPIRFLYGIGYLTVLTPFFSGHLDFPS